MVAIREQQGNASPSLPLTWYFVLEKDSAFCDPKDPDQIQMIKNLVLITI